MPDVDPASAASVQPALGDYLSTRLGRDVAFAAPVVELTDGRTTYVYAFQLAPDPALPDEWTRPLILRVFPLFDEAQQTAQAEREAAVQNWVADRGYPAPRALAVETGLAALGRPFIIMERLPGVPLLDRISLDLNEAFRLFERTADLQAELHSLPIYGFPVPYERPSIETLLAEYGDLIAAHGIRGLEPAFRLLERQKELVIPEEPVVCHNDFHPFNLVMDDDGNIGVVDWQAPALADRHCGVAWSSFVFTAVQPAPRNPLDAAVRPAVRLLQPAICRRYLDRYRTHFDLDPVRLCYWQAVRSFSLLVAIAVWKRGGGLEAGGKPDNVTFWTRPAIDSIRDYLRDRLRELHTLTARAT